jgi:hypothetical protein
MPLTCFVASSFATKMTKRMSIAEVQAYLSTWSALKTLWADGTAQRILDDVGATCVQLALVLAICALLRCRLYPHRGPPTASALSCEWALFFCGVKSVPLGFYVVS